MPAPKGKAGFRMVIPEIKMRSITGGPSAKTTPAPKERPPTVESPPLTPQPDEEPAKEPGETTLPEKPIVPRLPFEPVDSTPKESPESVEPRQPDETSAKKIEIPLLKPPAAPEDAIEARPPKKEVLKGKIRTSVPELTEAVQIKGALKALPIESMEAGDVVDEKEWVTLQKRREPAPIPGSEPAKEAKPEPEAPSETGQQREQLPSRESPPAAQPMTPSEPAPGPEAQPEPEPTPGPEVPKEQPQPDALPREVRPEEPPAKPLPEPQPEELPAPPKEVIPSPLDAEAQESHEVREYLKATSPILEELSLLMTKVPSLTIADYDPSDAEAPVVPKELFIQMDSMKRNLQILDSKTFAVIPPNRYSRFHTIIRQSISHTHQACDAIINFFTQGDIAALQQMQEHLIKARDLIRRTRDKTGRS